MNRSWRVYLSAFLVCGLQFLIPNAYFLIPAAQASIWYVNDTSTSGDAYTSAVGNDANAGSATAPFRTITKAMTAVQVGDTVFVDAGLYTYPVHVNFNILPY